MKIVVAIDSLKGSLTSLEAGEAIAEGCRRAMPDGGCQVIVRPLADGGEGTVEALTLGMGGEIVKTRVTGPLGEPVDCAWGILPNSGTAILEMAGAAGITLVPPEKRDPRNTTTYGVGQVIRAAIDRGCRRFLVGIGGSATNDGGIGMLQALGYGFLRADGTPVSPGARGVGELASITADHVIPELADCTFRVACDVTNPLCGELGCSAVFGPQKGATPEMIVEMDEALGAFATLAKTVNPDADAEYPGTGAAGGLGYAFRSFTNAVLESGVKIVLEETRLDDYVKDADYVITGEGRLDSQTVMGKAPIGVAQTAKRHGCRVLALAGSVTEDAGVCNDHGIDAFFPILRRITTLEEAMDPDAARQNLTDTAEQVFRLIRAGRQFIE